MADLTYLLDSLFTQKGGIASGILPEAVGGLGDILQRRGATDPRMFQNMLQDQGRQTQNLQRQLQGGLNRQGINASSGLGMALQGAVGQGGATGRQNLLANEASQQEQRFRQDLAMALGLLNPAMAYQNQIEQQGFMNRQLGNQQTGAFLGAAGALGGGMFAGPMGARIGGALASKLGSSA